MADKKSSHLKKRKLVLKTRRRVGAKRWLRLKKCANWIRNRRTIVAKAIWLALDAHGELALHAYEENWSWSL